MRSFWPNLVSHLSFLALVVFASSTQAKTVTVEFGFFGGGTGSGVLSNPGSGEITYDTSASRVSELSISVVLPPVSLFPDGLDVVAGEAFGDSFTISSSSISVFNDEGAGGISLDGYEILVNLADGPRIRGVQPNGLARFATLSSISFIASQNSDPISSDVLDEKLFSNFSISGSQPQVVLFNFIPDPNSPVNLSGQSFFEATGVTVEPSLVPIPSGFPFLIAALVSLALVNKRKLG